MKALSNSFAGIETNIKNYIFSEEFQAAQYGEQLYNGPGCVVRFVCKIPNVEDTTDCLVTRVLMKISNSNKEEPLYEDILTNIDVHNEIDFQYLFSEWGDYTINLIFHTNTGKDYTKQVKFTIDEDVFNSMAVKKVQKRLGNTLYNLNNLSLENELFSYSLTNEDIPEGAEFYSQYLYAGPDIDSIGMNSIIAIQLSETMQGKLKITQNETSQEIEFINEDDLYNILNENYLHYIWFIRWAYESIDSTNSPVPYLIGLRKNFTISSNMLSNEDGLNIINNNLYYKKNLYKNFAYSVNKRNYSTEKNIIYRLEVNYEFKLSTQNYILYTIANYKLYRNNIEVQNIDNIPIELLNETKFTKSFNIYDEDLKINLKLDFEDDVPQYDYYNIYGTTLYKITSIEYYEDNNDTVLRRDFINEERFIPIFHTLVDLEDDTAENTDTLVVIPTLKYLKHIDNQDDENMWTFHNASTGEDFHSDTLEQVPINITRPLLGKYKPMQLTPGYYDIILNAKIWDNETNIPMKVESMFLLK